MSIIRDNIYHYAYNGHQGMLGQRTAQNIQHWDLDMANQVSISTTLSYPNPSRRNLSEELRVSCNNNRVWCLPQNEKVKQRTRSLSYHVILFHQNILSFFKGNKITLVPHVLALDSGWSFMRCISLPVSLTLIYVLSIQGKKSFYIIK